MKVARTVECALGVKERGRWRESLRRPEEMVGTSAIGWEENKAARMVLVGIDSGKNGGMGAKNEGMR